MPDLKKLLDLPTDIDSKSTNLLLKAIKEHNREGFDYLEFLVSVDKLKAMDMDDLTAIKSAYATASTFGLSKDTLVSSGQYYISVLRKEYEAFKDALTRQIEKKIVAPKAKVQKMEKEYSEIDKKIEELIKRKERFKEEVDKIKSNLDKDQEDLTQREQKFNDTFNTIKDAIERNIQSFKDQL